MKVILNGDDLGYTRANTAGIFEAFQNGVLTSTTALSNAPYLHEAAFIARTHPEYGIGVHLTLTLGHPLSENKTLHDEDGNFFSVRKLMSQSVDQAEVYNEWKAQIDHFMEVFGKKPSHLDAHHHVYMQKEEWREIAVQLGIEYDLALRGMNEFAFVDEFYGTPTVEHMIEILQKYQDRDIEIMCHPGYCDLELYRSSSYALDRVKELDVLCDERLKDYIEKNGIELTDYIRR